MTKLFSGLGRFLLARERAKAIDSRVRVVDIAPRSLCRQRDVATRALSNQLGPLEGARDDAEPRAPDERVAREVANTWTAT
jgi:hypothetical protein